MEPETSDVSPPLLFVYRMLSTTFVYMMFLGCLMWAESMHRVRAGEAAIARAAVLRAEAEARAIRAQFNPHFVFNTLHSLMLLVRADPAGAERAIEDVATLIRYASIIQRRDIDAVPLAKELEVARRYLALERLRLQDRLTVEWVVDVDPGAVTVPAFSLQTLVENAIKHGLEAKSEGGCVRIELTAASDVLTIRVSDDGAGADASSIHPMPGHGLALLRSRLASRYGENGRLDWTTAPGQGFSATVTLPMERPTHLAELDVIEARQPARSGV
jgi:sensor histidine kinase YesM